MNHELQTTNSKLHITAYSDYVCPWCYIGLQRIERLQREFPVEVEWRPFECTGAAWADLRGRLGSSARAAAYATTSSPSRRTPASRCACRWSSPAPPRPEAAEFARRRLQAHARCSRRFEDARDIADADVL
jgi:predicted DsbA family dithiol-disulfide isomerase